MSTRMGFGLFCGICGSLVVNAARFQQGLQAKPVRIIENVRCWWFGPDIISSRHQFRKLTALWGQPFVTRLENHPERAGYRGRPLGCAKVARLDGYTFCRNTSAEMLLTSAALLKNMPYEA